MLEQTTAGGPTKLAAAQAAARLFIDRLALPADRATIVAFNIEARVRQPLTGDKTALLAALDDLPTQSGTRIDLGLQTAREELTGANALPGRNRVIVLLTDGQPTMVEPATVISVADEAKGAGLAIYTIGLGADVDAALLRVIASGSRYAYLAPSTADLQRIYSDIAYTIQCVNLDWPPGRPTPGP